MNYDDISRLAAENAKLRSTWLTNANEVASAIPYVEKAMQLDILSLNAFQAIPSGYSIPNVEQLGNRLMIENDYLKRYQSPLPSEALPQSITGSALAYSAGTLAASLLSGCCGDIRPDVKVWALQQVQKFDPSIQEESYVSIISKKLDLLYSGFTKEFQDAMLTARTSIAGASIPSSAGIAMRNVLESLKGNLLEVARKRSGNKNLRKWEEASQILAKGGIGSPEANQLIAKEIEWQQLHTETTLIAKNDSNLSSSDIQGIYFRWLGLLYGILTFIEFHDGT